MQNTSGGIFVLEDVNSKILEFYAKLIIDVKKGPLDRQLKDLEEEYTENKKEIGEKLELAPIVYEEEKITKPYLPKDILLYENEYGGFTSNGKEYQIAVNKENRLPTVWSNIMANEEFGTLVTESMGGFTCSKNSRLNRDSSWNNNQVLDIPSEVIYLQDEETLKSWSLGLNPMPDSKDYNIKYGFGYSIYEHESEDIKQKATIFVPTKESIKISLIELKNLNPKKKKINLVYYIKPVLGEDEEKTKEKLKLTFNENNNIVFLENKTNVEFEGVMYVSSSEKISSYTGSKASFFGKGNLENPESLKKVSLDKENSIGKEPIIAIELQVELESFETKEIVLLLGTEKNKIDCQDKAYKYTKIGNIENELKQVKKYWEELLGKVQIETPMKSFDILMNGWLIYQTITSRLKAKSAFYQSGGAFGFRDQLQDTIALKYFDTNIMKEQIIRNSKHQFIEGDVEHWWHEETKRGIRTRFSDDLLWLVYLVEEYINFTGDYSILDIETNYLQGPVLEDEVDEKYDIYLESNVKESIFKHCERAIEKSLQFGENGLPKIGSGDWNDGFSKVGNKKKGESVWLGFFMYDILTKWIPILEVRKQRIKDKRQKEEVESRKSKVGREQIETISQKAENIEIESHIEKNQNEELILENEEILKEDEKINKYKEIIEKLKKALNTKAWDGRWYKRAFMDTGEELRNNSK